MSTLSSEDRAEIQARADAATEGPWGAAKGATPDGKYLTTTKAEKEEFLRLSLNDDDAELWLVDNAEVIPAVTGDGPRAQANAEFIAHAREDIPKLLAELTRMEQALEREGLAAAIAGRLSWASMHWDLGNIDAHAAIADAIRLHVLGDNEGKTA